MKQFQAGLIEAFIGIIVGIAFSGILQSFKESGLITSNMVYLFTAIGFIGSLVTIFSFKTTGIVFTLGWIVGAWLLKDVLSIIDFLIYFIVPIIILVIRGIAFFKNQSSSDNI